MRGWLSGRRGTGGWRVAEVIILIYDFSAFLFFLTVKTTKHMRGTGGERVEGMGGKGGM